ncbi:MAG: hypothetical protein IJM19_03685 [Ruminococcus sp.]|nr:hypothetical protein [Ruminococcus sp.]
MDKNNQPNQKNKFTSISQMSVKQKSDIATWLYEIYRDFYVQNHSIPTEQSQHDELIEKLIQRVKQAKIRIPDKQIQLYYNSKQPPLLKRLKKEFPELSAE